MITRDSHTFWPTLSPGSRGRTQGALDLSTYLFYRVGTAIFEVAFGMLAWGMTLNELRIDAIFALAAVMGMTSFMLWRKPHMWRHDRALAALFIFDLIALSLFLGLTGGPSNPFSVLYLVQVTLASLLFRGRMVWVMTCSASLLYGLLFWWHDPLPAALGGHDMSMSGAPQMDHHAHHDMGHASTEPGQDSAFSAHLQGMWLAFTITAVLLTALVTRVTSALRSEQEHRIKTSRLLGLTTLAAGAAHELGGPLATIKVAAGELRHLLVHEAQIQELVTETEVIDAELGRARRILDRMMLDAGQIKGEGLSTVSLATLVEELEGGLDVMEVRDELSEGCREVEVRWPVDAITTMVEQLIKNAHEAHATHVVVCVACDDSSEVRLTIQDDGSGLSEEEMTRSGEPFFTTKATGSGMGLGIFLATSLCEQLGGTLTLANRTDGVTGCTVTMRLPLSSTMAGA
jgi:two-component system sensor histidine kinase RegB